MTQEFSRLRNRNISIHQWGFTLLEILLVIAAIAILAGIVIVAINPARQLAETRDAQRRSDVNTLSSAMVQYQIKSGQSLGLNYLSTCDGTAYNDTQYGICSDGSSCGGIDLAQYLVPDYIAAIPVDPSAASASDGYSGYTIFGESDRTTICAPLTENADQLISAKR